MRAYRLEIGKVVSTEPGRVITDNSLAFAWFYGDVVHADLNRRDAAAGSDILDRYEAAVSVVARIAWLTHATLDFIEQMRAQGMVQLADGVFAEPVTVDVTEVTQQAMVYVAPEGTEPPASLREDFGP